MWAMRRLVVYALVSAATTFVKPGWQPADDVRAVRSAFVVPSRLLVVGEGSIELGLCRGERAAFGVVVLWAKGQGWYQPGWHFQTYLSFHLLRTLYFWKGWLGVLIHVFTVPGLLVALSGFLLLRDRRTLAIVAGYGGGYVVAITAFQLHHAQPRLPAFAGRSPFWVWVWRDSCPPFAVSRATRSEPWPCRC